ncbi:MAG: cytochrome c3 family protein [Proteobacteria bacterium]|nr:cytochrome c3 family protein [Pseudomonadota bacterium]
MNRIVLIIFFVILSFKLSFALKIITPEDKSYITSPYVYVIAKLERDDATHVMITVNDIKSPLIYIASAEYKSQFRDYIIIDVELDNGENLVGISLFKDGKLIDEKRSIINVIKPPKVLPSGANRFYFHKEEKEKECLLCHASIENCSECHKRIISKKYVHGPAGSGDCNVCHVEEKKDNVKYMVSENIVGICVNCHDNMKLENYKYAHGPFAAGSCEVCHDLHSSDYPHQLKMETNDLCINCHQEFKKPGITHVVSKHPLSGKKDPSRPGKMLQCSSCHNPHGENTPVFFVRGVKSRMELCAICHKK